MRKSFHVEVYAAVCSVLGILFLCSGVNSQELALQGARANLKIGITVKGSGILSLERWILILPIGACRMCWI